MNITGLEFDDQNSAHLARHGIDDNLVWEVLLGTPRFAINAPRPDRSGSHLMIGPSASGRLWTIVLVEVDNDLGTWRPITGWPSTTKETKTWHAGA